MLFGVRHLRWVRAIAWSSALGWRRSNYARGGEEARAVALRAALSRTRGLPHAALPPRPPRRPPRAGVRAAAGCGRALTCIACLRCERVGEVLHSV